MNDPAFLNGWLDRSLICVSGKGGTGKTWTSCHLAQKAAKLGKKVIIFESSPLANVPFQFDKEIEESSDLVEHKEIQIAENIWWVNLRPEACLKEYLVQYLSFSVLYKKVFDRKIVKSFLNVVPGLSETITFGRMMFTMSEKQHRKYDLGIYDGPASGHFYNAVMTPSGIINSGMSGPLVNEVGKVHDFFKDPKKVMMILVTNPSGLILDETVDFFQKLKNNCEYDLAGLVLNRNIPNSLEYAKFKKCYDEYFAPIDVYEVQCLREGSLPSV